jgi:hypothetical protein
MMRELYPTEIADMPPWMSSLEWQAQQWVKYGDIWYHYKRKDNEWWSKKDEHTDAQKLSCPPPWWEIAAHWASVHDVPVADMDLVDTPDGLVWHDSGSQAARPGDLEPSPAASQVAGQRLSAQLRDGPGAAADGLV